MLNTRKIAFAAVAAAVAFALGAAAWAGSLRRVEPRRVCMVNDRVYDRDQIPVEIEGRTYFGCCEMCKERLSRDPSVREAIDPVTGRRVDKARAVVAADAEGRVRYFESEESLARFGQAR